MRHDVWQGKVSLEAARDDYGVVLKPTGPDDPPEIDLSATQLLRSKLRASRSALPMLVALDMHHIWEVSAGGSDDPSNLIALCATCHALYHRGTIKQESIYVCKAMLVAITRAFDVEAIDRLLFLESCKKDFLVVSGDGLLHFARLIAAGFASVDRKANNSWQLVTYAVNISDKGRQLVQAWKEGDRTRLQHVVGGS